MNESLFPARDPRQRPWHRGRSREPARPWSGALASDPAAITAAVTRGVCRWLEDSGFATLREFKLGTGRRADVAGLSAQGLIAMVEVKSTAADYHADDKWLEYVPYCDAFSFAVPPDFPWKILPATCGVVLADAYAATVVRVAPLHRLHAARRRALTLRFAIAAGQRLSVLTDPRE